jgi:hypothetical protein
MYEHGKLLTYNYRRCRCDACREASRNYKRNLRATRPEVRVRERTVALNYKKNLRVYVQSLKKKPCTDCGIQYPPYVMHFDHLGIEPKIFGIGQLKSKRLIDAEIPKCELVCANCHAVRSHNRRTKSELTKD